MTISDCLTHSQVLSDEMELSKCMYFDILHERTSKRMLLSLYMILRGAKQMFSLLLHPSLSLKGF